MCKHILVATDGSRLADKAADAAIGLARDLGARLTGFRANEDYLIMRQAAGAGGSIMQEARQTC